MKLEKLTLKNFRGYCNETQICFNDLTAFVGKNDTGKSTILEALDIFFNDGKGTVKIEKEDISKGSQENNIEIGVAFSDLPSEIIIDETNPTNLTDEYLLNRDCQLEIIKKYLNTGKVKVYIKANHPNGEDTRELLLKKNNVLKKIVENKKIECKDKTKNAVLRKAIWRHFEGSGQLNKEEIKIDASKEDARNIWDKLVFYMPLYALFQSDRSNDEGDSEIQNPMKLAVSEIFKTEALNQELNKIAEKVKDKLETVANNTLDKLKEMNPEIAGELKPIIPDTNSLKWADVFKSVTITSDEGIPLNKRGSGVKRLILLNFFRAEAERRKRDRMVPDMIYAIEEPETSQHIGHQNKLIDAFISLSKTNHTQVILTTHSTNIVKKISLEKLEYLKLVIKEEGELQVKDANYRSLTYGSGNEVNFIAFDIATEEYHTELYSHLQYKCKDLFRTEINKSVNSLEDGYMKYYNENSEKVEYITLHKYIRNQIHHPENIENERFDDEQLRISIEKMRELIKNKCPQLPNPISSVTP